MSTKILLLQQNEGVRRARSLVFGGAYFHSLQLGGETEVHEYLARENVDVILNDCRGAESKGLEWVENLRKEQPKAKVVLVTEAMDLPMVIRSIRLGVKDVFAGPLDLATVSKRLGEIAGEKDSTAEALRKADWTTFQEFFQNLGDAPPAKAAPPSAGRRTAKISNEDSASLSAERAQLHEEQKKLHDQLQELEKRRTEVARAEQRVREGTTPSRAPVGDEQALRRERESLRMQVMELESERDLMQKTLDEKEEALRIALASSELLKSGQSAAPAQATAAPFALPPAGADPEALALAQQEAAKARLRLAEIEDKLAQQEAKLADAVAEATRSREQLLQCERERDQAKDFLHAKEKALANASATLQRLQTEVAEYERKLRESLQSQSSDAATQEVARQEREKTVAQLASLEAERDFLRDQMAAMETELQATRETVDRLQREAADFAQRLQDANRLASGGDAALRQEREQLLAKVARLESERNLAREQFTAKEKALAEATTTVQKLRHELVQVTQKAREREASVAASPGQDPALQRDLERALERLGLVELERDHARDQLSAKEAALDIANSTVESLRGEVEHYLERLRNQPLSPTAPTVNDEALRTERDQLRARLGKAERDRDQARELLQAKERALGEATDALKRLRVEGDISAARSIEHHSRREAELADAEQRLLRTQSEVQAAQEKMDEAWASLHAEQERIAARKREIDDQAVAVANRERLLALERSRVSPSTGAEAVGASERRLRLLRTELASLAAALNEREAALRTQELRVEQLLSKADTDLRSVAAKESMLSSRAEEIEQRIAVAEARAAEIIAVAQARAEAEERATSGLSEALRREREAVRKAESRYLSACHEVGEQLQALADREATMRKREFQLDERENTIREVLQRVLSDANALVRGEAPKQVFAGEDPNASTGAALSACDTTRSELESQRRTFGASAKRITELAAEIDQDEPRNP